MALGAAFQTSYLKHLCMSAPSQLTAYPELAWPKSHHPVSGYHKTFARPYVRKTTQLQRTFKQMSLMIFALLQNQCLAKTWTANSTMFLLAKDHQLTLSVAGHHAPADWLPRQPCALVSSVQRLHQISVLVPWQSRGKPRNAFAHPAVSSRMLWMKIYPIQM